jgi:hypothetical protein
MFDATDVLDVVSLDASGVTAALHMVEARATLELFGPDGRLMQVATTSRIEPPRVRGAWVVGAPPSGRALLAMGTVAPGAPLPLILYLHRRRQVRARLHRLGPFWLSEAVGGRLRLTIDDGEHSTTVKSGWAATGAVGLRHTRSRLTHPLRPSLEIS